MKKRTRARELALQFLYQLDLRGAEFLPEAKSFVSAEERDAETTRFALKLVLGTHEHRAAIDALIGSVAQNWNIARMAVVDRNVLRLATYELLHCPEVPPKVAVNEAIELGKRYSTQNSGAFINGILDKIMNRARAPEADQAGAPAAAATAPAIVPAAAPARATEPAESPAAAPAASRDAERPDAGAAAERA